MSIKIPRLRRRQRTPAVVAIHLTLVILAYLAAYSLRFDFAIPQLELDRFVRTLPYLLVIRYAALAMMKVYRGSWRHFGIHDFVALVTAVSASEIVFVAVTFLAGELGGFPRSVLLLDWGIFIFGAGGVRFAVRWAGEGSLPGTSNGGKRAIVVGAGNAAERFIRERSTIRGELRLVGLLDDDPRTHGLAIHGVPVVGSIDRVGAMAKQLSAELLIIAIPSATGEQIRRIVNLCSAANVDFKILPSMQELLNGEVPIDQLRDVQVEDLLGRTPIHLDLEAVERDLVTKTVLVTGGAGSIGSELAKQIAGFCPGRLVIVDQAESPLYFVHLELTKAYPGLEIVPIVADITDDHRLAWIFSQYSPHYVFHAAAYKHVPMLESNVVEAIRNNVLGTFKLVQRSTAHGVEKFVLISTDKAVNPSSVMGATKRLAEKIALSQLIAGSGSTDFRAVRFGNVLGSDGSVIPLFRRQLAAGGPLTVTHPDVTRYFISIPEAVQLVLQAAALPEAAGRISMLDMGQPVRIVDLAEQLIRLSGRVPYRDVHIVFSGLRPGEKMAEQLMSPAETSVPTSVEKIQILETDRSSGGVVFDAALGRLFALIPTGTRERLLHELATLVPEYSAPVIEREVAIPTISSDLVPESRPRVPSMMRPPVREPAVRGALAST